MHPDIKKAIAALPDLTVRQLQAKFAEIRQAGRDRCQREIASNTSQQ